MDHIHSSIEDRLFQLERGFHSSYTFSFFQVLLPMIIFSYSLVFADKADVSDEIDNSFSHYQQAVNNLNNAISYINQCNNANTVDEVNNNARIADGSLFQAISQLEYAANSASDAAYHARSIDCYNSASSAQSAEDYYRNAKSELNNGKSSLFFLSNEDDIDQINYYLQNINNNICQANYYLKNAVSALNNSSSNLSNCE